MENKMPSYSKLRYLAAVLLFCVFTGKSQKLSRYYVSNSQEKGTLYFVLPQSGFENQTSKLDYDITYLSRADSATFNFSITSKQVALVNALHITTAKKGIVLQVKKLYIEPVKSSWTARYTAKIAYADVQQLFSLETAPVFEFEDSASRISLNCNQKHWQKLKSINSRIFQVINYNT